MPDRSAEHLAQAAETNAAIARAESENRISLLTIHGIYKVLIGVSIIGADPMAFTGPSFRYIPIDGLAVIVAVAGMVLVISSLTGSRAGQLVGLAGIIAFDLALAGGLMATYLSWVGERPPVVYPIWVYLHFTTIMLIHAFSIVRNGRPPGA